jgi:hypothetical protein
VFQECPVSKLIEAFKDSNQYDEAKGTYKKKGAVRAMNPRVTDLIKYLYGQAVDLRRMQDAEVLNHVCRVMKSEYWKGDTVSNVHKELQANPPESGPVPRNEDIRTAIQGFRSLAITLLEASSSFFTFVNSSDLLIRDLSVNCFCS